MGKIRTTPISVKMKKMIGIRILVAMITINLAACFILEKHDDIYQYLGVYSSVTESECNMDIIINPDGNGKAVQSCRLEDGSHRDELEETSFRWKIKNHSLSIYYSGNEVKFVYDLSLSREIFGGTGVANGLILKTKGNNIFDGYGDKFWKNIKNK